ncbi:10214_t:CDS:2, partial [Cetraspora pellucida]
MTNKANLNTLFTSITSLTQTVNEVKSILTSSDVRNQLETTKNSIESLKRQLDIYEQNQSEFITSMQRINNEHGIKIQRIEDTLMTTTTMLENFSTSTSAVQTTVNNILSHIQNRNNNINILNTINNSPRAISTANPILTAKIHDKMRYFNGFEDLEDSESQTLNKKYVYDFELGPKNRKNKRITQNYVELFIKEFDTQNKREAYFKTLKKEQNTTPAAKLLNDQRSRHRKRCDTKSSSRLAVLNKIPENQLNHPKSEVKKLFSFEATSPEVSDNEEASIASLFGEQDYDSEVPRKKLLVPVLSWMSDEVIKRTRLEKLNSGGRHSYTTPMPREIVKIADPR